MSERNHPTRFLYLFLCIFFIGSNVHSAFALGEVYIVPKETSHTTYSKCWNWAVPRSEYYSTTQHAFKEGRCLNNTCGPNCLKTSPDRTYLGTATAVFKDLLPGKYELWIYYRISDNRTKAFPWKITTDGYGNTSASGIINQYGKMKCCGEWYLMGVTRSKPLDIRHTATLVAGSDTADFPGYDRRSSSYGGAKLVRIGAPGPMPASAAFIPGIMLLDILRPEEHVAFIPALLLLMNADEKKKNRKWRCIDCGGYKKEKKKKK